MKKWPAFCFSLGLAFGIIGTAWAQTSQSNTLDLVPKQFPAPLVLPDQYPIPEETEFISPPSPPSQDADGSPWHTTEAISSPNPYIISTLTDEAFLPALRDFNRQERLPNQYYWHNTTGGWAFVHCRDFEGNHWYGWEDGSKFYWTLWRKGSFWWHDTMAKRWLYFHAGYWWWPNPQDAELFQVYSDGSYYTCNAKGIVLSSKGENPGEYRSDWNGPFQGDFASRGTGTGGRQNGGHSGHSGGHNHPNGGQQPWHGINSNHNPSLAMANNQNP